MARPKRQRKGFLAHVNEKYTALFGAPWNEEPADRVLAVLWKELRRHANGAGTDSVLDSESAQLLHEAYSLREAIERLARKRGADLWPYFRRLHAALYVQVSPTDPGLEVPLSALEPVVTPGAKRRRMVIRIVSCFPDFWDDLPKAVGGASAGAGKNKENALLAGVTAALFLSGYLTDGPRATESAPKAFQRLAQTVRADLQRIPGFKVTVEPLQGPLIPVERDASGAITRVVQHPGWSGPRLETRSEPAGPPVRLVPAKLGRVKH